MEDIQSWWEVPSIAYFCSLFRTAFNLPDFDIEELEEVLLTDGTEESASSLLTELIVRLLNGCLGNNDTSAFNYQMYLRRLFRRKCQETSRYNPFNTDIDFQFLPLRTKVEILYALCDFRLDAEDVFDLFKNLEAESLRVEPLGWDDNDSAYWYFYSTRLYREDTVKKTKGRSKKKKNKESKKRGWFCGDDLHDDENTERVWQVVCYTETDWNDLTERFSKATSKVEKELYRSLSQNFLPEIPRLFQEKERLQRKRLLELAPRRTSCRVLQKIKQKEEEIKQTVLGVRDRKDSRNDRHDEARENRAKRRNLLRTQSTSSNSSEDSASEKEMPPVAPVVSKRKRSIEKKSKNSSATHKGEPPPEPPAKHGRKTNNSLSSATGQILISDNEEPVNSTRKKLKTSQIQTEEDIQTDMYKVLEQLSAHEDAWPFLDPVEEEYAPNYYAVIRRPMDLHKMEERLDKGYYTDFSMFKADFKLIVNNCRLYNGQDNEYTTMVDNLQGAFDRLTEKYINRISSSDEEIAVEFPIPTPSRKHKRKSSKSPSHHKRKKRKSHADGGELKLSSSSDPVPDTNETEENESENKESFKVKDGKVKKKRKGHHRHGKHSKNHKKLSHKSDGDHEKSSKSSKRKHLKEGKKSKQKKKKSKHSHEKETEQTLERTYSHESLESSNRSRSASPLPSIHTPSPSPTEPEQVSDPDFFKDKFDKIKERRRAATKDSWESLFDYKQKSGDKQKSKVPIPEKAKNQKLRETIEKLKAKNEKFKDTSLFNSLFPKSSRSNLDKSNSDLNITRESSTNDNDEDTSDGDYELNGQKDKHDKSVNRKKQKRNSAKNESASEALEQAVKDISKLLDDAPKGSDLSSPCDSPAQTVSTEDQDNSRQDDESLQSERGILNKRDLTKKRPSSREPKVVKRREIQRTIDRLQPGKSKGNLLTNVPTTQKAEDVTPLGPLNKIRDNNKTEESSPKLSLGSVLPTVEFSLGNDHNFTNNDEIKEAHMSKITNVSDEEITNSENTKDENKSEMGSVLETKVEDVKKVEDTTPKANQEKATPNLSAWFKAFGTPKNTMTVPVKKKVESYERNEKTADTEAKTISMKNSTKYDSPIGEISPNPEGGDSPLPNVSNTPRQRRTSTGSSVSERSSFSQDLDSPRHQMSHMSPLLRSPASPRTDEFQKITYPIINGTVRAGFYQDTTSMKSSPEKSCSPREGPQSPYSPYSQHVYASNNAMGVPTPNYFGDHNKSPLPTYGQNPPPYYDSSKASLVSKPVRCRDDYTALGPDTYQPNHFSGNYPPSSSPYPQEQQSPLPYPQGQQSPLPYPQGQQSPSPYPQRQQSPLPYPQGQQSPLPYPQGQQSPLPYTQEQQSPLPYQQEQQSPLPYPQAQQVQQSPLPYTHGQQSSLPYPQGQPHSPLSKATTTPAPAPTQVLTDHKNATFPVKKRAYTENDMTSSNNNKVSNLKEHSIVAHNKDDYQKMVHSMHTITTLNTSSVDEIAVALTEKSEMAKINALREKNFTECSERPCHNIESRTNVVYENHDTNEKKKDMSTVQSKVLDVMMSKKDNIDMINMGYNNVETERRISGEVIDLDFMSQRELNKQHLQSQHSKGYEVEAIALNLGINSQQQLQKTLNKSNMIPNVVPPEKIEVNMTVNHNVNDYEAIPMTTQNVSNFSLNDIEAANKKLYSCNPVANNAGVVDYGNWKNHHQIRKQDMLPSDYSSYGNDKLKPDMSVASVSAINYNKNLQQQQYHNYNSSRSTLQRPQELSQNLPSELRIPNPRGLHKTDPMTASTLSESDLMVKNMETSLKSQKSEKLIQRLQYKPAYSHSSLQLESLRNLQNIPQMLERYTNDERYLSSFAAGTSSLYHDKSFQMAQMSQMFAKSVASEIHPASTSGSIYSQPSMVMSKDNIYKSPVNLQTAHIDNKTKSKRKRTSEPKQSPVMANQSFHTSSCATDALSSVKTSMVPGSAFNFGASTNMSALSGGLYGDNSGFSIEDFRNNTANQLMAANYMAAAVAHQRNNTESNMEKVVKPAHQNSSHTSTGSFPFMSHSQVRAGYPFVGADPSSPLYQQYLQRHQEELLRHTGAQIMGLYPAGYPGSLSVRQPYDSINRPSWI